MRLRASRARSVGQTWGGGASSLMSMTLAHAPHERWRALGAADARMAAMAYPKKLLADGEQVAAELRPHWKEIFWPAVALLVVLPLATYATAVVPEGNAQLPARVAIAVVALVLLVWWTLRPFLRWLTTAYVVTDRRIITRQGILARSGRDMPMSRVNDVSFEHSNVLERMLGCGTLVIESGGERGQLVLRDVPHVEEVQRDIYRLAEADEERRRRGGDDVDE